MLKSICSALLVFVPGTSIVWATAHPPAFRSSPYNVRVYGEPPLRANALSEVAAATLEPMSEDDLATLRQRNVAGPLRSNGLVRELATSIAVSSGSVTTAGIHQGWAGSVSVSAAQALRLRLTDVSIPPEATLWVYSRDSEPVGFDSSLSEAGILWTPSVEGDRIFLEISAPAGSDFRFVVSAVADLRELKPGVATPAPCLRDVACDSTQSVRDLGSAVALYQFVKSDGSYICSGGLMNDRPEGIPPYFLTAHHCLSTQSQAATVEAFWDYVSSSCGAAPPSRYSRPRTNGASIMVTSADTDVTLLRLSSVPGERWYLGWDPNPVTAGTQLYRVSHPDGEPKRVSVTSVEQTAGTCSTLPRPRYIYSSKISGDTQGGSSGAPVWYGQGYVVGQLFGQCGPNPEESCNYQNRTVDGALAQSWTLIEPYLDPPDPQTCAACTPNAQTACVMGNRFRVTVAWTNRFVTPAKSGTGKVIKYAENKPKVTPEYGAMSEIAYFYMFDEAPTDIETIVRMINGVGINDKYWVLVTGFANCEYTVTITDTKTCKTWTRTNPNGTYPMIVDVNAFARP